MDQKELDDWRNKRFTAEHGGKIAGLVPTDQPCDRCGTKENVSLESSRTAYHWDGTGKNPNQPVPLCPPCAKEHHGHWDDMWAEVHG